MFVAKNRNGPDGIVMPLFIDWSIVKCEVLENPEEQDLSNITIVPPTKFKSKKRMSVFEF